MKYWEDMQSKYGFSACASTPAGAELYREAYLKTMNYLLARFESVVRVVGYDRPGFHNSVLIFNIPVALFKTLPPNVRSGKEPCPDSVIPVDEPEVATDEAFDRAFEVAEQEFSPDAYVHIKAKLRAKGLMTDLRKLKACQLVPDQETATEEETVNT